MNGEKKDKDNAETQRAPSFEEEKWRKRKR